MPPARRVLALGLAAALAASCTRERNTGRHEPASTSAPRPLGTPGPLAPPERPSHPWNPPPQAPARSTPLGEPAWLDVALAPDRSALAVLVSGELRLVDPRTDRTRFARPVPGRAGRVAFTRDGRCVAWLGERDGELRAVVLDAQDGSVLAQTRPGVLPRSPDAGAALEPPREVRAMMPGPEGDALWVAHGGGIARLDARAPGSFARVERAGVDASSRVAQDGSAVFTPVRGGLAAEPSREVAVRFAECAAPALFAVDPGRGRAAFFCAGDADRGAGVVTLVQTADGAVAGRWTVPTPRALYVLDERSVLTLGAGRGEAAVLRAPGNVERRRATLGPVDHLEVAPDGRHALGLQRASGALSVFALPDGRVVCDASLALAAHVRGAGFAPDGALWVLGEGLADDAPGPTLARLALPGCAPAIVRAPAVRRVVGAAEWLAAAQMFVFTGSTVDGSGVLALPVAAPDAVRALVQPYALGLLGNSPGDRVAVALRTADALETQVFRLVPAAARVEGALAGGLTFVAFCGATLAAFRDRPAGLFAFDTDAMRPVARLATQGASGDCAGETLLLAESASLGVLDARTGEARLRLLFDAPGARVSAVRALPGGREALVAFAPAGVARVALPDVGASGPRDR